MKKEIIMLDLFSGAGGFTKGFLDAGYKIKKHYFSEIDKHAVANYKYNFKDAEYLGSVTDVSGNGIERPNIITFGSPCQDFSLAGKRSGMAGQRSVLILEAIRIISECRPSVFIWENVKGAFSSNSGSDFWAIISAFANIGGYRLEWQLLNTSWFLPQNRERIYLVGHLDGRSEPGVFPIGENDILFDSEKRDTENKRKRIRSYNTRSNCISTRYYKDGSENLIKVNSATISGYEIANEGDSINFSVPNSKTRRGRVGKGKAQTLDTACNQAVLVAGVTMERTEEGKRLRKKYEAGEVEHGYNEHRRPSVRKDGFTNTIDTNEKSRTIFSTGQVRRLTEIECERLQGFPDNWTEYGDYNGIIKPIPKTQRYKLMGNAVTVRVVQAVAERLNLI